MKEQLEEKLGTALAWFEYYQVSHMYHELASRGQICKDLTPFKLLMIASSLPI